jgi:acetyltransferase-like isoleucine patch superfamily enzyme
VLFQSIIRTLLFRLSDAFVDYGHNAPFLYARSMLLKAAGVDVRRGAGVDRGFDFMVMGGKIVVGDHSIVGIRNRFWNYGPITIGRFCMFAADVSLTNGGHDKHSFEPFSGPLVIGDGCWIGNGARIVKPVRIGDNAIIAAGAVVVDDVPPAAIVAGIPAKIIGYRELPDRVWHAGGIWFSPKTFERVG